MPNLHVVLGVVVIQSCTPAVPPSETPSCARLPATCGAAEADSCCASPEVPGGSYLRGYDVAGDDRSGTTAFPATVTDFRLDRYLVTVGRFRAFVNAGLGTQARAPAAGAGAHPGLAGSGWDATWDGRLTTGSSALIAALKCDPDFQTWTDAPAGNENRPMNCISWFEAAAFCAWDGGFLPTEAQWNYAAAGGDQQRAYPWSTPPGSLALDPTDASYDEDNAEDCVGDGVPGCTVADLTPVGTRPAGDSRWGQADLAGDVLEWLLDAGGQYPLPCTDCAVLGPATRRTIRGGSFADGPNGLRTARRLHLSPSSRNALVGVRCAREP